MKRWMMLLGMLGLMLMTLAVPDAHAASKTLYVGTCKGWSPFQTIQSAVEAASGGGFTIYVCPGTYNESVQVRSKQDLTIRNYVVKNQSTPLIDSNGNDGIDIFDSKDGCALLMPLVLSMLPDRPKPRCAITLSTQATLVFISTTGATRARRKTIPSALSLTTGFNLSLVVVLQSSKTRSRRLITASMFFLPVN